MEAQLAAYRARKAKEHSSATTSLFSSSLSLFRRSSSSVKQTENNDKPSPKAKPKDQEKTDSDSSAPKVSPSTPPSAPLPASPPDAPVFSYRLLLHPTFLKVILWLILWGLFVELEFGAVYFVVSSLYIIYANTRTGPKEDGSLSAYSVFNPNYERLEGTFTSEQFEKELRYGAGSVH